MDKLARPETEQLTPINSALVNEQPDFVRRLLRGRGQLTEREIDAFIEQNRSGDQ